jgi:hypothetical protein
MAKQPVSFAAGNTPATLEHENKGLSLAGIQPKIIKKVTYPTLSHTHDGQIVAFEVMKPMERSIKLVKQADGRMPKEPPMIMIVTDLTDGVEKQYVCPAILVSEFSNEGTYPDDSYVGKAFMIRKGAKREGKDYRDLDIVEVDKADLIAQVKARYAEAARETQTA